ncbi:MAG: hypothetical protein J0L92_22290 [Deltaproteobacteria bacterium]|jgi:hypothetical protein|nr:hypothetical protein [Deltaproteobacteria bacterium]
MSHETSRSTDRSARMPSAKDTWRAASFSPKDRRKSAPERREETDRAVTGDRRKSALKTIAALLRF